MILIKNSMLFLLALLITMQASKASLHYSNFEQFDNYCIQKLPTLKALSTITNKINFQALFNEKKDFQTFRAVDASEFELALDEFFAMSDLSSLAQSNAWINNENMQVEFSNAHSLSYKPYAQKVLVDDSDIMALRGDMHGDIHSLLCFLRDLKNKGFTSSTNGFKIIDPKLKIIFLGDYVDRGIYGVEVIYTILRLKITNPDQVILIRGNHEDISICSQYGFIAELQGKFADVSSTVRTRIVKKLQKFYELLPAVAYIGCQENEHSYNFVQCCHGGVEIGFNPQVLLASNNKQYQLLGELRQATQCLQLRKFLPKNFNIRSYLTLQCTCKNHLPAEPASFDHPWNGFMWNDFQPFASSDLIVQQGRGIKYSKEITEAALQLASSSTHKVCGIIRAHQHNQSNADPLMQQMLASHGVARHWSNSTGISFNPWQGIVCTLLLSPDNSVALKLGGFKGFNFDTTLLITLAPLFTEWNMQILNTDIYTEFLTSKI